jgi:competence protein ComEC
MLLSAANPQLAVISCGSGNSYGHPHAETMERLAVQGCPSFVTAKTGQITIRIHKNRIVVNTFVENT